MNQDTHDQLVERIYDAALAPERWVQVIEGLADALGGHSGWLSQLDAETANGSGLIARIDPVMPTRYVEYYANLNLFARHANPADHLRRWTPTIEVDSHLVDREVLERSEFFNDFMRPQRVQNVLMMGLALEGRQAMTINIHRPPGVGQFEGEAIRFARALHPHMIRAFRIGRAVADLRDTVDATAAAMEQSSQAFFVLDGLGRIRRMNRLAERLLERRSGLTTVNGRLTALKADAARTLRALIGAAASPDASARAGGGMALPMAWDMTPMSLSVAPVRSDRWPVVGEGRLVLVSVTDPRREIEVSDETLRALFGLTGAEIRIARALLEGRTPREAADGHGVSLATVRTQLARIYAKTGVAGQAELSRLMTRIAAPLD